MTSLLQGLQHQRLGLLPRVDIAGDLTRLVLLVEIQFRTRRSFYTLNRLATATHHSGRPAAALDDIDVGLLDYRRFLLLLAPRLLLRDDRPPVVCVIFYHRLWGYGLRSYGLLGRRRALEPVAPEPVVEDN